MKKYSFISQSEPTDEQLEWLMNNMIEDVKERAKAAEITRQKSLKELFNKSAEEVKKMKEKHVL